MLVITMIYIDSSFLLCLLLKDPDWAYIFCEIMFKDIKTRKLPTAISIITLFETGVRLILRPKRGKMLIKELSFGNGGSWSNMPSRTSESIADETPFSIYGNISILLTVLS